MQPHVAESEDSSREEAIEHLVKQARAYVALDDPTELIGDLRAALRVSREALACRAGVHHRTIQNMECGQSANPAINTVRATLIALLDLERERG